MGPADYAIVTGASRGLGVALCRQLLEEGRSVIATARASEPPAELAGGERLTWHAGDLSTTAGALDLAAAVRRSIDYRGASSILLINNAGMIAPVGPLARLDRSQIVPHLTVNVAAPMVLAGELLADVEESGNRVPATIINVTSGAAEKPYFGRAVYCAGKAGVDMFTKTLAREFADRGLPHRVWAVRPGAVDTDMQRYSRELPDEATGEREKFIRLKAEGKLLAPEKSAQLLLRTAGDERVENGAIVDVRVLYPGEV